MPEAILILANAAEELRAKTDRLERLRRDSIAAAWGDFERAKAALRE